MIVGTWFDLALMYTGWFFGLLNGWVLAVVHVQGYIENVGDL